MHIVQGVVPDVELATQISWAIIGFPLWLEGSTLDQTDLDGDLE
jgi:hypothetical protein